MDHQAKNTLQVPNPNQDMTFSILDAHIDGDKDTFKILSAKKWYVRLWYLISNPMCYLFKGYVKF